MFLIIIFCNKVLLPLKLFINKICTVHCYHIYQFCTSMLWTSRFSGNCSNQYRIFACIRPSHFHKPWKVKLCKFSSGEDSCQSHVNKLHYLWGWWEYFKEFQKLFKLYFFRKMTFYLGSCTFNGKTWSLTVCQLKLNSNFSIELHMAVFLNKLFILK